MAETLDQATILRNLANSKREKSTKRVKSDTLLSKVTAFLNDDNQQFLAVEDVFPPNTKHSSIVARFRAIIVENKLDELAYPVISDDHVFLVKLVDTTG
jgi:hypothetical protein